MEYEAHNKGVSSLIMLSEGTLLSGGEKDRRIAAWDSLQNYKKITDTKVRISYKLIELFVLILLFCSFQKYSVVYVQFIPNDLEEMTVISMLELPKIIF